MQAPRDREKDRKARQLVTDRLRLFYEALKASAHNEAQALMEKLKRLLDNNP
jgi:hypothetical protein